MIYKSFSKIKTEIYENYKSELLKKRRQEQVDKLMSDDKLEGYIIKLAKNLIRWKLTNNIPDFIEAQYFALSYMKYLPTMMNLASDTALERWNKVGSWFKKKRAKENSIKVKKKICENFDSEIYLELLTKQKIEEDDKKLFWNTPAGFQLCLESTSLWNPKSNLCYSCQYKNICKEVLKTQFPELLDIRLKIISEKTFLNKMKRRKIIL